VTKNNEYIEPKIYVSIFNEYGETVVSRHLSSRKKLVDVDISFLKHVITRWKKHNRRLRKEEETNSYNTIEPKLIFPLEVNRIYEGKITLCRIADGGQISLIDKWLIKRAFIFQSPESEDNTNIPSVESSLKILNESAIKAIRALSKDQFDDSYREYKNFHLLLLELGETKIDGKNLNYGIIEGTWDSIYKDWTRSYRNIFDESVIALPQQDDFFRTCSYTAYYLIDKIFLIPSMTGLSSVIEFQGYLWYRLNEWWREQVEKQDGTEHSNSIPTELLSPESKIYTDAAMFFIGAWESTQRVIIIKADKHTDTWQDFSAVFNAFDSHLTETLSFVGRAVLSGNRYAARAAAEIIMRWQGNINISLHDSTNDYWLTHGIKAAKATPNLLEQPWSQVENILENSDNLRGNHSQKAVLKSILFSYWQDISALLAGFLINWTLLAANGNPDSTGNFLSKEILYKLLKGSLDDDASNDGKSSFASTLQDFFIIFLRQNTRHHWTTGSYQGKLSSICRKIDGITEPARISGRVYTGHGDSIDDLRMPFIILGMLLCKENEPDILSQRTKESLGFIMEDDNTAKNLDYSLKNHIELIDKIDILLISRVFGDYVLPKEKTIPSVVANDIVVDTSIAETSEIESSSLHYENRREQVRQLFISLQQFVHDYRTKRVQELPISESKIMEIVENASSEAFDKETANFPVNLFKQIEFTTDILPERKLTSKYPKGMLTEPIMDDVHYGEKWHSELISPYVYAHLIFSIFDTVKANKQVENATATNQQSYANLLLEKAEKIKGLGLTPIIIVETFQTPRWIRGWEAARWDTSLQIPQNITIERKEQRKRGGYLFHVNNIPVYEGKALTECTIIMAEETLQRIRFRQFDNGYPVNVIYHLDSNDPWYGVLTYEWQREVILGNEPVFFITYPQPTTTDDDIT